MAGILIFIVIFSSFVFASFKAFTAIKRSSIIFDEFGQSKILLFLVLLYPLGPLVALLGGIIIPKIIVLVFPSQLVPMMLLMGDGIVTKIGLLIIGLLCYLPSLVIARRQYRIFEVAGTDRVLGAQSSLSYTSTSALIGVMYISIVFIWLVAASAIAAS